MDNLTRARNILKTIHVDRDDKDAFHPVTVIDAKGFTVLVAPDTSATDGQPITMTSSNPTLEKLLYYAERMSEGAPEFDDMSFILDSYDFEDDVVDCFAMLFFDHTVNVHGLTLIDPALTTAIGGVPPNVVPISGTNG